MIEPPWEFRNEVDLLSRLLCSYHSEYIYMMCWKYGYPSLSWTEMHPSKNYTSSHPVEVDIGSALRKEALSDMH